MESILGYAIYLQPLAWMWLYGQRLSEKLNLVVYPAGTAAAVWLRVSGWSYAHLTNELLITYVLMVMFVTWVFRSRVGIQPMCLGFLIVFLNSFYWEFPIHVADLLEMDNLGVVAIQTMHLLPAPFLLSAGMKLRPRWWYTSCWAWFIILGFTYLRLEHMLPYPWNIISLYVSRVLGLATLLIILRYPEQGESKVYQNIRSILNHDR